MATQSPYDFLIKLVMIGCTGVGKTSISMRLVDHGFSEIFVATIGVEIKLKQFEQGSNHSKVQIWDTSGQQMFFGMFKSYCTGAYGLVIVYDITSRESFDKVPMLYANSGLDQSAHLFKVVIGNKSDLEALRSVAFEEGKALADSIGARFIETSAKTTHNIDTAFSSLVGTIMCSLAEQSP